MKPKEVTTNEILAHVLERWSSTFSKKKKKKTFSMFRMSKDAKMAGDTRVYFCTVKKTQGPVWGGKMLKYNVKIEKK